MIADIEESEDKYIFRLMSRSVSGICPECKKTSLKVHGYQPREVRDLPTLGKPVYLNIS